MLRVAGFATRTGERSVSLRPVCGPYPIGFRSRFWGADGGVVFSRAIEMEVSMKVRKLSLGVIALFVGASLFVGAGVLGREGQPPAVADFTFSSSRASPGNQFATAAVDLPIGNQQQDSYAEVEGSIINDFEAGSKPIKDINIWVEDRNGTLLEGIGGGCPVTDFRNSSTDGGSLAAATLAGQFGNVATFNLANPISTRATGNYNAQIGALKPPVPNQFVLKMQASYVKADTTKHFDVLGGKPFRFDDHEKNFDVVQATNRTGVFLGLTNADTTHAISAVRVTLVADDPGVDLVGAHIEDLLSNVVPGTSTQLAPDGSYLEVTGLNVRNGTGLALWIDLNTPYERDTVFRVRAIY